MGKYSNEFKEKVIADYLAGMLINEIANKYDINLSTLNNWRKRAGLPGRYKSCESEEKTTRAGFYDCVHYCSWKRCAILEEVVCRTNGKCSFYEKEKY